MSGRNEMLYILLPVHNRREITRRFVACLKSQTHQDFHLVLIDDGSTDATAAMVRDEIAALTVITGTGTWWWAGSLQQGYRWLEAQGVAPDAPLLIINDDTEFDAEFLADGLEVLDQLRKTLLVAEGYALDTGALHDASIRIDWSRLSFKPVANGEEPHCLSTRGLFMRFQDFKEIGGFLPRLLPHYLSDYEFTIRARRKGFLLMTTPQLKLFFNLNSTGCHDLALNSVSDAFKHYFSTKSAANLPAWTIFLLLACPLPWKFLNLGRVWGWGAKDVTAAALRTVALKLSGRSK